MGSIKIVVDNNGAEGFVAEHGFALWIEMADRTILFDTGNREALLPNCRKLDLSFTALTDLVISHGHYDHTGGVDLVVREAADIQVYIHQAAMQPRYSNGEVETRSVRMPAASMRSIWSLPEDSLHWLTHPFKLAPDIGITGPIARLTGYEDSGGAFYYDPWGKRPDPIEDDNALWLNSSEGLIVCVGCSHAGIVNTLQAVMEITGERRIRTVIGGLHLINASPERLAKTAAALNDFDLHQLVACHCTGDESFAYLSEHLNCEVVQGYAGYCMSL
jgi:7,8-dihydropterin-6-yl-methyl-4-(beta-D-ribofuranosyl)aminobenzene 5'-phosphate synthase